MKAVLLAVRLAQLMGSASADLLVMKLASWQVAQMVGRMVAQWVCWKSVWKLAALTLSVCLLAEKMAMTAWSKAAEKELVWVLLLAEVTELMTDCY